MATAARLTIPFWRNDDVFEFHLRVRGVDLTNVPLALEARAPDTPGAPKLALARVADASADGLRIASVTIVDGLIQSDLRLQITKATRQALPYAAAIGDAFMLPFALAMGGRTRLVGEFQILPHSLGSLNAPSDRAVGALRPATGSCGAGATLTIEADGGATIVLDGADLIGPLVEAAEAASELSVDRAAAAAASAAAVNIVVEPLANTAGSSADDTGRWVTREMADGSFRVQKLSDAFGRRLDLAIDRLEADAADSDARVDVVEAAAALAGFVVEVAANTATANADDAGAWSIRELADGSVRIQKLADANGRRLDHALDQAEARLTALERLESLASPIQRRRLKASLYEGAPRRVMAADPIIVAASAVTTIVGGSLIGPYHPRIAMLGGGRVGHQDFPADFSRGASTTQNANYRTSQLMIVEFVIPAAVLELHFFQGTRSRVDVSIDGIATNEAGYAFAASSSGHDYLHLTLPPAFVGCTMRCVVEERSWGGLMIPADAQLAALPQAIDASAVFIGDSITEGAGASRPWRSWPMQAAYRLGLHNPVQSGVGSTGYLKGGHVNRYTFRERIDDVLSAVDGDPPDVVIVAGGFNDVDFPPAAVGAEALLYFQQLRAAAPAMEIIVVGPWTDHNNPAEAYNHPNIIARRDAIFAAAGQVVRCHTIDVADVVTTANRDAVFYVRDGGGAIVAGDGVHPVDFGHALYGRIVADRAAAIIAAF